ncbi:MULTISPECIES: asparagine synthase (glutamine-hydrolyzing) [Thalassospira]|jgi:asparagine synthase (glutamine-hydrolysing)|uniref:asparagine synthase (glutamine-hydrolyzing) n=1 Tax=Thalassospira TaxID=168934 RepID=UPI000D76AE8C|nr:MULTISPECIES: asparagine synthase (glutamine-hydrolyzing) [Thalassospira]MBL4843245.1 asparagine synthase (glutamine-hydrolyzing) [Thalassospira sp.]PXX34665.1 asparagine synthase (glutamine-hydrolysing) [Thalassospira sp. 11-3]HBX59963.1 asparagine synthase (glutamine-hydrolyzing) [Methylophaga sp.]|tara:strand:- start:5414 stop:7327 length:1914 start_codon:yes stop_codon:yes gene_type:complete
MCGIAGYAGLNTSFVKDGAKKLEAMSKLIAHRGPDGFGVWEAPACSAGFAHRRLSILDLSLAGAQPMEGQNETVICHNGEVYNYLELREKLSSGWRFKSHTDTETILAAYAKYGLDCVTHLRGMFAFAIWDERNKRMFCARDRFGIKPFYYTVVDGVFYFASEAKALLPFLSSIDTDPNALAEYLTFQYTIGEHTLFAGIKQLMPGHALCIENGELRVWRYWDVEYQIDYDHSESWFENRLRELINDSLAVHLRSDVPVGAYVSGGIDSSLMGLLASRHDDTNRLAFNGRFTEFPGYDESEYAQIVADQMNGKLHISDITHNDFRKHIRDVIYHLDFPVAGPGSFPQYMVSKLAGEHVKVVLGGQGGDEIFGGYARYLLAYLEQSLKAAMDGTYKNGNYVVTIESIVPNLGLLREYKPLMQQFWKEGMFGPLDERYFRLANRANDMKEEIDWDALDMRRVFESYMSIFNNTANVRKEAYFDSMTHFDFKCLLPALLQVEDRMSMAHGLESRVPLLDHPLIEFAATIPADIKFSGGRMKHLLKKTFDDIIPHEVLNRRDKMGFPVPLKEWFGGELRGMVTEIFCDLRDSHRPYINADAVLANFDQAGQFSRKAWGLLSLELWHQEFHDKASEYRALLH